MGVSNTGASVPATAMRERPRVSPNAVREDELPAAMRMALDAARASRPNHQLALIAFYSCENGREIARMGPEAAVVDGTPAHISSFLAPKHLVVLSVTFTETTRSNVRTLTHVLVTRTQPNGLQFGIDV
jgi:hypothetical protein